MNTPQKTYLYSTVFLVGACTLSVEFTVSRMLQTVFGTSNLVWANVIGLVLFFLTLGYFLGGRLADQRPRFEFYYLLAAITGLCSITFLLLTSWLLKWGAAALLQLNFNTLTTSFLAVVFSLAIPITLLGALSPFAVRLAVSNVEESGRKSGLIFAVSTWGSIAGTYLPVLVTIPLYGSRITAGIFGMLLFTAGLGGIALHRRDPKVALGILALFPFLFVPWKSTVKNHPAQIFETETSYNYVQVIETGNCRYLLLNEGEAIHSALCKDPQKEISQGYWSQMVAGPYWNQHFRAPERVAIIGNAGGSIAQLFAKYFPGTKILGIELDPKITEVGKHFFSLNDLKMEIVNGDGRYELLKRKEKFDLIAIDAFKLPYIPWHLTTLEFFSLVKDHLSENGVLTINAGRAEADRRLIEAMVSTLKQVYPSVHVADVPGSFNSVIYATSLPTEKRFLQDNVKLLEQNQAALAALLESTLSRTTIAEKVGPIVTDEIAPTEAIADSIVLHFLLRNGRQGMQKLKI